MIYFFCAGKRKYWRIFRFPDYLLALLSELNYLYFVIGEFYT